jgi:hypothetical protein
VHCYQAGRQPLASPLARIRVRPMLFWHEKGSDFGERILLNHGYIKNDHPYAGRAYPCRNRGG